MEAAGPCGNSPLIGCGLFVDGDVGAAGATGKGEECVKVNGSHVVVEAMRRGAHPEEACREALMRIVRNYERDRELLRRFDMTFYALSLTVSTPLSHCGARPTPVAARLASSMPSAIWMARVWCGAVTCWNEPYYREHSPTPCGNACRLVWTVGTR